MNFTLCLAGQDCYDKERSTTVCLILTFVELILASFLFMYPIGTKIIEMIPSQYKRKNNWSNNPPSRSSEKSMSNSEDFHPGLLHVESAPKETDREGKSLQSLSSPLLQLLTLDDYT